MATPVVKRVGEGNAHGFVVTLANNESIIACPCGKTHKVDVAYGRRKVGCKSRFRAPCKRKISVHWVAPPPKPEPRPAPPPRPKPPQPSYEDEDRYPIRSFGGWPRSY